MAERASAVYAGSFDPFHLGHEHIVRRARLLFDELIIGVGINPEKEPFLNTEDRVDAIRRVVAAWPNVRVEAFEGLTVRFVRDQGASVLIRGIRALADMDYEFTMSLANARLAPEIETVFLVSHKQDMDLSSSLIRHIAQYGRNRDLREFVPEPVVELINKRLASTR